ncbi:hypothetical protein K1719_020304 [Acacia pycnantha]|nr:hypothetical protein K1719_020304 [Acacia pycnantha]
MDPSGNSDGGKTPPSSQNQTQLHWSGQTHGTANNELHFINEPSLPLQNAGGRRAPPSRPRPIDIEEPRQPPLGAKQESPPKKRRRANQESRPKKRRRANQESHIINEQVPPPHHAANGRGAQPSPSSQRQLGIQESGQPPSRVNNESLTVRQSSGPLYSAGRRTGSQALDDQLLQHQQHALRVNQESHTMKKPSPPPFYFGRTTYSRNLKDQILQIQHLLRVNQESHTIKKPSPSQAWEKTLLQKQLEDELFLHQRALRIHQQSHIINEQVPPPHHAANGRGAQPSPSSQRPLGIQEPGQPPSRVNNESLTVRQSSGPLYSAGRRTGSQAFDDQLLQHQQHALRVNQESHTMKKPSPPPFYFGRTTYSRNLKDQILQIQHLLRVNQESHTIKKPSPSQAWEKTLLQKQLEDELFLHQRALRIHQQSHTMKKPSSSEDRRGGVVARSYANWNNTSTTQWRSDPTGQKSLCNAWGIRLNREEETRAASGLQSSNLSSAALRRHLEEERNSVQFASSNVVSLPPEMSPPAAPSLANRVQLVENISGLQSSPPLRDPPEEASETVEFWQSLINNFLGHSSGLQSSNMSSAALRRHLEEERNIYEPMENNASPFVLENNFLRHCWGLLSSNVVSPPSEMSPPAAPSLANSVQFWENFLLGDPLAAPLPDPSEVLVESNRQNLTDRTPDNNPFVPENNFLRHSSGLQSSNVVSPPPQMSPPASSSLANRTLEEEEHHRGGPRRLEEPRQTPIIANQESHIINEPSRHRIVPPTTKNTSVVDLRLGIGKPHQTPTQLGIQEPEQPPSRVNNGSLTIQPSRLVCFAGLITKLQALDDKLLDMLSKRYKLLQNLQHALRVNQESHTMKKPPSSSSEGWRGGVVALRCAKCKNTSTTQWRSDPTGQKTQQGGRDKSRIGITVIEHSVATGNVIFGGNNTLFLGSN